MPSSADTIFHYTNNIHNIIAILEEGFVPYYCLEDYKILNNIKPLKVALPMVSFCDVPLSRAYTPMKKYGYYAIGMKKKWAIQNNITPLLYSTLDSPLMKSFKAIYNTSDRKLEPNSEEKRKQVIRLRYFISFIKPYEGTLVRGQKTYSNYRFYDEREWRYVPNNSLYTYKMYTEDQYKKERDKNSGAKIKFSKNLAFSPDDVKFIIVKKESQLLYMHNTITKIKRRFYQEDKVKVLSSRLISSENLLEDF